MSTFTLEQTQQIAAPSDLVLSTDEIITITHRKRAREQMEDLAALGIPAVLRHDNTVCVLRVDLARRAIGGANV